MAKYFVIKEIGGQDSTPYAVAEHGEAWDGKWKRKCLFIHGWHETEDQARASAHSWLYPDKAA